MYYMYCIVHIYIYGKGVKDKNVNSKCTHRQMTRLDCTSNGNILEIHELGKN
jgi:hypothetical protein